MATAPAPERPGKGKVKVSLRGRGRIDNRGKNPTAKSPVLNTPQNRQRFASGSPAQQIAQEEGQNAQDAIEPDFVNPEGGAGDSYDPDMPLNDEGGVGNSEYDPEAHPTDDKDASNAQENGVGEADLANAENGASTDDGQDSSVVSEAEKDSDDDEKGMSAWRYSISDTKNKAKKKASNTKKAIFTFIGGLGVTLAIAGIMAIPQLALQQFKEAVTSASSRATQLVGERLEKFTAQYYISKLVPTAGQDDCGTTLRRGCNKVLTGNIFSKTFNNWNQNRIETKLFNNFGIEIESAPSTDFRGGREYRVIQNGRVVGAGGPRGIAKISGEFIEAETKWKGILGRRHFRSAAAFHGAKKWCFILCFKRDEFGTKNISRLKQLQIKLIARVVEPANARAGAYLFCLVSSCSPQELDRDTNRAAREALEASSEKMQDIVSEIGDKRVGRYLTEKVFDKIFKTAAPKVIGSLAGSAGIVTALYLLDTVDQLVQKVEDNSISKFVYDRNVAAAVEYSAMIMSGIDGTIDIPKNEGIASLLRLPGSIAGNLANTTAAQAGSESRLSIEEISAMYELVDGFEQSRMYAASNNRPLPERQCLDGVVLTKDSAELVCPETKLRQTVGIEEALNSGSLGTVKDIALGPYRACTPITGTPCLNDLVHGALDKIDSFVDFVTGPAVGAITSLGPVKSAINTVSGVFGGVFSAIINNMFRLSTDVLTEDGATAIDQVMAANDASTNTMIKGYEDENGNMQGLGGRLLNDQEVAELDQYFAQKEQEEFERKDFFARYLDISSAKSLASTSLFRLSTILPIRKPISGINLSGNSLFSSAIAGISGQASAEAGTRSLLGRSQNFGVAQYGFSLDELEEDVEVTTPEECERRAIEREESKVMDEETGEVVYTKSNICMLDEVVNDTATKIYNLDASSARLTGSGLAGVSIAEYIDGPVIPCEGRSIGLESDYFAPGQNALNWEEIASAMGGASGIIGQDTNGSDMMVFVRDACAGETNPRTIVIASSIHGSENGGQRVSFELLFNASLPSDVRVIAIPEVNKAAIASNGRNNPNGVNLNRNFDYRWGSSGNNTPFSGDYRGASAASEAETQNVQNFLTALGPSSAFFAYHDCINKVFYSGEATYDRSRPIAEAYTGMIDGSTASCNNKSWPWTVAANRGYGFMEAWYADATNSPALLVEMNNSESAAYMKEHADTIVRLLDEGIIR